MKEIGVCVLGLLLLLTGCGEKNSSWKSVDHSQTVAWVSRSWAAESDLDKELQRDLARWYNVNLHSKYPEPGYEQAYNSILYYDSGVMGYVEFPSQGCCIPIFHGAGENGFYHDPASPIPIGDGGHSVLRFEGNLELMKGEKVILWILGEPITYTVGDTGRDYCTLLCDDLRYVCGRELEQ